MALISIDRVNKHYGAVHVLKDISLDIEEGEFVALLGPSGCGKTTLLRAIAGFCDIDSGNIVIDGRELRNVAPNKRPVNLVFQSYALFPHLSVRENVAFGPKRAGLAKSDVRDVVDDALTTVGMADFAERQPGQLSGGQQQRVALARAIANKPKVLLLDEPLAALDLKLRKRMQIELKQLQQQLGITFLFVTHDQEEALVMADRIVVMNDGKVVQIGSGEEVYSRPANKYVADFIGDVNVIPCQMSEDGSQLRIAGESVCLPYEVSGDGSNLVLMVRPEAVVIQPDGSNFTRLEVRVEHRVFVGSATRLFVRSKAGHQIVIQMAGLIKAGDQPVGSTLVVGWPNEAGKLLAV